jgi:hypothetical protein
MKNQKNHHRDNSLPSKLGGGFINTYQKSSTLLPLIGAKDGYNLSIQGGAPLLKNPGASFTEEQSIFQKQSHSVVEGTFGISKAEEQANNQSGILERDENVMLHKTEKQVHAEFRAA